MDPLSTIKPWLDVLVDYGLPLVVTGYVMWLAHRYIPKWIDSSIDSQLKIPLALQELTQAIVRASNEVAAVRQDSIQARRDLDQIKEAGRHTLNACQRYFASTIPETGDGESIITELQKGVDALESHHPIQ